MLEGMLVLEGMLELAGMVAVHFGRAGPADKPELTGTAALAGEPAVADKGVVGKPGLGRTDILGVDHTGSANLDQVGKAVEHKELLVGKELVGCG